MRFSNAALRLFLVLVATIASVAANAQEIVLKCERSTKQEQVIGDYDWADLNRGIFTPTKSRTIARYNVAGNGLGYSFEHDGQLIFLFGDTISNNPDLPWGRYSKQPYADYHAHDPMAVSNTTDPESGLLLDFLTKPDGTLLFVEPPGIEMGPDGIPNSGISLNGNIYLVCNTGADVHATNHHTKDQSVLVKFDEKTQTFDPIRVISRLNPRLSTNSPEQGHFIFTAPHAFNWPKPPEGAPSPRT
jgi:hypothetical protein